MSNSQIEEAGPVWAKRVTRYMFDGRSYGTMRTAYKARAGKMIGRVVRAVVARELGLPEHSDELNDASKEAFRRMFTFDGDHYAGRFIQFTADFMAKREGEGPWFHVQLASLVRFRLTLAATKSPGGTSWLEHFRAWNPELVAELEERCSEWRR